MNIEQTWQDIQSLPGLIYKINKKDNEAIQLLDKLSRILFSEPVIAGCSNCHIKAYHKLTNLTYQNLIEMEQRQFKLKKNIALEYPRRSGMHFNSETLTDAMAKDYLINHPDGVSNFDVFPMDQNGNLKLHEDAIQVVDEEKSLDKMNKTELQEKYKEVTGDEPEESLTKKELISVIEDFAD